MLFHNSKRNIENVFSLAYEYEGEDRFKMVVSDVQGSCECFVQKCVSAYGTGVRAD